MTSNTTRTKKGHFLKGVSGNPSGRPSGSKNRVNILKISLEEQFREGNFDKITKILNSVVQDALEGDKVAKKMVWDAAISKATLSEDKSGNGMAPGVIIRHMEVQKQGDMIDVPSDRIVSRKNDGLGAEHRARVRERGRRMAGYAEPRDIIDVPDNMEKDNAK